MAGKKIVATKKVVADVVASKTARASTRNRTKEEPFKASGELDRIVALNDGNHAYLRDPRDGKLWHLATDSPEWDNLVATLIADPVHGPRIEAEINSMRRSKIYERFVALTETSGE